MPVLSDWTQPANTVVIVAGVYEAGSSDLYRSVANGGGGDGSFIDGTRELQSGQNIERIRYVSNGIRFNDQPSGEDLGAFFDTGGPAEGGTLYLVTDDGSWNTPVVFANGHGNNVVLTTSSEIDTALSGLSTGDSFVLAITVPDTGVRNITGSASSGIPTVTGGIDTVLPVVVLPPGQDFALGEGTEAVFNRWQWTGDLGLILPRYVENEGVARLRIVDINGNNGTIQVQTAPDATTTPGLDGPQLTSAWETYIEALTVYFTTGAGTRVLTLPGPVHAQNQTSDIDQIEPYIWVTSVAKEAEALSFMQAYANATSEQRATARAVLSNGVPIAVDITGGASSGVPAVTGAIDIVLPVNITGEASSGVPVATGGIDVSGVVLISGGASSGVPTVTGEIEAIRNVLITGEASSGIPTVTGAIQATRDVEITGSASSGIPTVTGEIKAIRNVIITGSASSGVPTVTGGIDTRKDVELNDFLFAISPSSEYATTAGESFKVKE